MICLSELWLNDRLFIYDNNSACIKYWILTLSSELSLPHTHFMSSKDTAYIFYCYVIYVIINIHEIFNMDYLYKFNSIGSNF